MTPARRFKVCNRSLGIVLILMLVSGIQLEAISGRHVWSVWVHIALGVILTVLSLYHIYLHYKSGNWFARFAKNKNTVTRVLWWVFLLTAATGFAATAIWIAGQHHSPLGGIHGKIGFLMFIVSAIHVISHKHHRKALNRRR